MSVVLAIKTVVSDVLAVVYGIKTAAGSVKSYLNITELLQILGPAVLHGGLTWVAILQLVQANASAIFVGPYAGVIVGGLTVLVQAVRLFQKGADPSPAGK
jgi:hypothetical protein